MADERNFDVGGHWSRLNWSDEAWALWMTIATVCRSVQYYRHSSHGVGMLYAGFLFSSVGAVLGMRIVSRAWSLMWGLITVSNVVCLVIQVQGIWRDFANSLHC